MENKTNQNEVTEKKINTIASILAAKHKNGTLDKKYFSKKRKKSYLDIKDCCDENFDKIFGQERVNYGK